MKKLVAAGRAFYASALVVYGIQQLYFGTFRDVFFSVYQKRLPLLNVFSYVFGAYLIATGILILVAGKGRKASLILGSVFMALFLGTHITYELFSEPNKLYHLGLWTTPLKELALAGGAFVVASSFRTNTAERLGFLEKIAPYGNLFFLYTMISFGISHIIYAPFLVGTVPKWIANGDFWVTLTGVTLTASGIAIMLGIRIRIIALLLSLQIFIWVWLVHVPGTLSNPLTANRGNLLASAFDALAFSGTALLISLTMKKQQWVEDVEKWGEQDQITS
ncbi:hypothetical protein L0663_19070 [Dyadobacter sp. CY107]|uniref:hypothetical protein n=1 Tax=Dyadobacter fanqingshengii TaxID=2906443 RepID=UPI001F3983DD|nr:hypothetical protein [Dyadobacter fanqingshengii]MCF2505502.1 hypothetical protein [Dyadobacter fanqingshengii]